MPYPGTKIGYNREYVVSVSGASYLRVMAKTSNLEICSFLVFCAFQIAVWGNSN